MILTIHRGTHEIGGSCVEICTDKAKILIDLGMPLDYDKHTTEEQRQRRYNIIVVVWYYENPSLMRIIAKTELWYMK